MNNVAMGIPAIFGVGTQTYGRQEPRLNVTPTGKVTVKGETPAGVPEQIANTFFPQKPQAQGIIDNTIEQLKRGIISKETAKDRIRRALLEDATTNINTDPEKRQHLNPVLIQNLKTNAKRDIKEIYNDYTLTEQEKKIQIKKVLNNLKLRVTQLAVVK